MGRKDVANSGNYKSSDKEDQDRDQIRGSGGSDKEELAKEDILAKGFSAWWQQQLERKMLVARVCARCHLFMLHSLFTLFFTLFHAIKGQSPLKSYILKAIKSAESAFSVAKNCGKSA